MRALDGGAPSPHAPARCSSLRGRIGHFRPPADARPFLPPTSEGCVAVKAATPTRTEAR
jgi:hypothetical protein